MNKKHDTPFILCVGFVRPHISHVGPKKYFDKFPIDSIKLANTLENDTVDCAKILARDFNYGNGSKDRLENFMATIRAGGFEKGLKRLSQAYTAFENLVDDQLGIVLNALKSIDYADNTMVILTSDHGCLMGEKNWIYRNSL